MKRFSILFFLPTFLILCTTGYTQVVNSTTKKKISIGVGLSTDIMMQVPSDIKTRVINHGANVFATYNIPFGKSPLSFAIGVGLSSHNIYGNFYVDNTTAKTTLVKIPDSVSYSRSKITLAYIEIPIEFRLKTKSKVSVALGLKGGYLIGSSSKYVGTGEITTSNYTLNTTEKVRVKFWGIKNLESFTYGPTLRVGYKWFNLTGYYMLSHLFTQGRGPDMYPISVGFLIMPF